MQTFETNARFPTRYMIEQAGLHIHTRKHKNLNSETFFPFEDIKRDKFLHTERSFSFLLYGAIVFFIGVVKFISSTAAEVFRDYFSFIVFIVVSLLFFVCYVFCRPTRYYVKTFSGPLIRFDVKKNASQIEAFVNSLILERDKYIKKNYGKANLRLSYDAQYSNFRIMYREGILTRQEVEENILELNKLFPQSIPGHSFLGYSAN